MTETLDPLVQIRGLSKNYGSFCALKDLTLEVLPGEVFALLGPNGAGKTTAIKILTGMLVPTSGNAEIGEYDCFSERVRTMSLVGYQPDEPVFQDHLTGWDLIRFSGDMRGMNSEKALASATDVADRLGLTADLNEYASNYSKGMRKKLAAVLALMHEPRVLILDEPTNGLDPYATRDFHSIIRERAETGAAIFFSTHLLDQAQKCCHRVGIIHRGCLAACGTLDSLRKETGQSLEDIFFEATGGTPLSADTGMES